MSSVGVIYNCEGSGHAMRMLSIAQRLEGREVDCKLAGGGPSQEFLEANNVSSYTPETTDMRSLVDGRLTQNSISTLKDPLDRVKHLMSWIEENDFDCIISDDPCGLLAARAKKIDFYVVSHVSKDIPVSRIESIATFLLNAAFIKEAEEFFYPSLWQCPDSDRLTKVGPLAPEYKGEAEGEFEILVVPSAISDNTETICKTLQEDGYTVKKVGGEDWSPKPSLRPYIRKASTVVCSGYSTVMEASVERTPCILNPVTSEQKGVSKKLEGIRGFREHSGSLSREISELQTPREYRNGAIDIADAVIRDLRQ
jgi:UDP:flavonoid glycosyltransferase YjiC (YdhE family)